MGDIMEFPDTVEEFMEEYKMVDKHEIYSNGTEYVPIFRMEQWFEHCKAQSANAKRYIDADALIAKWEEDIKHIPNASFRAMMQGAINEVSNAPTADVVPYSIEDGKITIDLSEIIDKIHGCAIKLYFGKSGADMRGENNELHKRL